MSDPAVIEYAFPDNPQTTGYCVFPANLEDDGLVLFHATPAGNANSILKAGFRIPDPNGVNGLPSVSFAKRSLAALNHAMMMRRSLPGDYCIIAVRYDTLDRKGLANNLEDIHDYTLEPPPQIIGFCTVPSSYKHV